MSALAVLDSVIQRSGHIVACDVVQARAAVAELIAAADMAEKCLPWADPEARRLRAALAAVGEGQG